MLAVFLAFKFYPEQLRGHTIVSFVDNMGVIHAVVNGASKAIDLAAFVQALHGRIVHLQVTVWWDYVASKSNIADGGSRDGATCEMSRKAGISLREVSLPFLPQSFPYTPSQEWSAWW